jgi:hypothetical protein
MGESSPETLAFFVGNQAAQHMTCVQTIIDHPQMPVSGTETVSDKNIWDFYSKKLLASRRGHDIQGSVISMLKN